ncbi:hypothetical protein AEGHOMDF_6065 [Methylobacterium soli]|nr:hypothetical protein AEGHOMDF_6065 [Methylobacterium soli]
MPAAASALPSAWKLALRPRRSPARACPTRPMLIAAMAGVSTQLAAEWAAMARSTMRKFGQTASAKALPEIAATATPAAKRFERTASTKAPPGTWPSRLTRLPTVRAKPISDWVHLAWVK